MVKGTTPLYQFSSPPLAIVKSDTSAFRAVSLRRPYCDIKALATPLLPLASAFRYADAFVLHNSHKENTNVIFKEYQNGKLSFFIKQKKY